MGYLERVIGGGAFLPLTLGKRSHDPQAFWESKGIQNWNEPPCSLLGYRELQGT